MLFSFVHFLFFTAAFASVTTRTNLRCSTNLGLTSIEDVATHTVTETISADIVTVGFKVTVIVTETPTTVMTTTKQEHALVTSTTKVDNSGIVFSTTKTIYFKSTEIVNEVVIQTVRPTTYNTTTISVVVPTPSGFRPINGSTGTAILTSATGTTSKTSKATTSTKVSKSVTGISSKSSKATPSASTSHKKGNVKRTWKSTMGLRGAMVAPSISAKVFATKVDCLRLMTVETTVYSVGKYTGTATTTTLQPSSSTTTTKSTITSVSTIPRHKAARTETILESSIFTVTTTSTFTSKHEIPHTLTLSTTVTAYAACASSNFIGPILTNGSRIVNVYNRGLDAYTAYDIGIAETAEGCCVECMTKAGGCTGSVFDGMVCKLLKNEGGCTPGTAVGFWVSKPEEEMWSIQEPWPEYFVSNGPCGVLNDGGVGG